MSDEPIELLFDGADGSIRFASSSLATAFRQVVHRWPASPGSGPEGAFAEVSESRERWAINVLRPEPLQKRHRPVNAICDLIVDLNWSRLRQNTELMCLHAAGIDVGGALLVLPSGRRAGKSTLTAELARRGHRVFSDDILAVGLDETGIANGIATGIAPRLRLPLPDDAPPAFRDWVSADPGPANRQYKYLTGAPVAGYGSALPLGAIVTLHRVEEDVDPSFEEIAPQDVLPVLIHQNFGRMVHAGRALAAFGAIARGLPCLKLTYGRFDRAADALEERVTRAVPRGGAMAGTGHGRLPEFQRDKVPFDPAGTYRRREGFHSVETADGTFVADADGVGIFRLNPGMVPIWLLLEDPMTPAEISAVLADIYRDVDPETIRRDTERALAQLNETGLIVPAP